MKIHHFKTSAAILVIGSILLTSSMVLAGSHVKLLGPADVAVQIKKDWSDAVALGCGQYERTRITKVTMLTSAQYQKWLKSLGAGKDPFNNMKDNAAYVKVSFPSQMSADDGVATYGPVEKTAQASDFTNLKGMPFCDRSSGD